MSNDCMFTNLNSGTPEVNDSPVLEYRTIINDSNDPGYVNRVLIATPTTGLVRIEWVQGRYGQIIPANWGMVQMTQWMNSYIPLRYQVSDAQNLIVKEAIEKEFEWLLFIEHDVILPPNAFLILNEYLREKDTPVVSGLYYTRSYPSQPLVYRGRGTSYYNKFKIGDKVWVDGVPMGCLLVHMGIIREMWKDSEEYMVGQVLTRRVFDFPRNLWGDPETGFFNTVTGTSDLDWCTRVIKGGYLEKAGWKKYQRKKYPFLVDTNLFCGHINPDGQVFPV